VRLSRPAWIGPAAVVLMLVAPLTGQGMLATGLILVAAIAVKHRARGYQPPRFGDGTHPAGASGHS
jgi:hypothetical protein